MNQRSLIRALFALALLAAGTIGWRQYQAAAGLRADNLRLQAEIDDQAMWMDMKKVGDAWKSDAYEHARH